MTPEIARLRIDMVADMLRNVSDRFEEDQTAIPNKQDVFARHIVRLRFVREMTVNLMTEAVDAKLELEAQLISEMGRMVMTLIEDIHLRMTPTSGRMN